MRKKLIFIFCLLLLSGCKQITEDTNYVAKVNNCLKEDIITNGVGLGYKFYVPKGVKKLKDYDYNQIFLIDETYLYLYVDIISYFNNIKVEYKENKDAEYLVENAFSKEAASEIKEGLIQVVENPTGTGHDVKVAGVTIAGKTGTAELKATKDSEGDTLGWFNCFTTNQEAEENLLIVSMAKNRPTVFLKGIIRNLISNY
jgi:hypothetical protein